MCSTGECCTGSQRRRSIMEGGLKIKSLVESISVVE